MAKNNKSVGWHSWISAGKGKKTKKMPVGTTGFQQIMKKRYGKC